MDFDPSWTPFQRLKVDCRDLTCPRRRPRDSNGTSVSTLRILSIVIHRFRWECPIRDRKPLFQDSKMLLVLDPPYIVVIWTFRRSGENSKWLHVVPLSDGCGEWLHIVLLSDGSGEWLHIVRLSGGCGYILFLITTGIQEVMSKMRFWGVFHNRREFLALDSIWSWQDLANIL